jgi:hypothetical protein
MAKMTAQYGLRVVGLDREGKINGLNLMSPADDNRSFVPTEAPECLLLSHAVRSGTDRECLCGRQLPFSARDILHSGTPRCDPVANIGSQSKEGAARAVIGEEREQENTADGGQKGGKNFEIRQPRKRAI